jgi:hypothetical protein
MTLAIVAVVASLCPTQDKVSLKSLPKQGDKISTVSKMSMKINLTIVGGGQRMESVMEQRGSEKHSVEVLELADGKVVKASHHIEEDVEETREPGAEEFARKENPLHGKKIVVALKEGKRTYEGAEGVEEKELQSLDLEDEFANAFPAGPVAVGDSWEVSPEAVKKIFDDDKLEGKMTVKLAEVKDHEGRRCAFLDTQVELRGALEHGMTLAAKMKGTVVVWIERGYTLKANLEGTVTMKGKTEEAEVSGEGPMTVEAAATIK